MNYTAGSIDDYIAQLPADRQEAVRKLTTVIADHLPAGFEQTIGYGMIAFVVPHSMYPAGYHCDPKLPLPFINIASQKNFIALYHMGIYADEKLLSWFTAEYPRHSKTKLDMGKSCIRFKKPGEIPYDLMAALAQKISPAEWIKMYKQILTK